MTNLHKVVNLGVNTIFISRFPEDILLTFAVLLGLLANYSTEINGYLLEYHEGYSDKRAIVSGYIIRIM